MRDGDRKGKAEHNAVGSNARTRVVGLRRAVTGERGRAICRSLGGDQMARTTPGHDGKQWRAMTVSSGGP
jgi:hypothetical protein